MVCISENFMIVLKMARVLGITCNASRSSYDVIARSPAASFDGHFGFDYSITSKQVELSKCSVRSQPLSDFQDIYQQLLHI